MFIFHHEKNLMLILLVFFVLCKHNMKRKKLAFWPYLENGGNFLENGGKNLDFGFSKMLISPFFDRFWPFDHSRKSEILALN